MATKKQTLKTWFQNGKKPNQEQFWNWMDAYWHKDEKLPLETLEGLDELLGGFATEEQLEGLALTNASNLTEENVVAWKTLLGVDELPENLGTIDWEEQEGNVFTKEQVNDLLEVIESKLESVEQAFPAVNDAIDEMEDQIEDLETNLSLAGHGLDYDEEQDQVVLKDKEGNDISTTKLPLSKVGKTGKYEDLTGKPDLSVFDNLVEAETFDDFPPEGEKGKVYVVEDTGYIYRWAGSSVGYSQLTDQTAIWGEISGNIEEQTDLKLKFDEILNLIPGDLQSVTDGGNSTNSAILITGQENFGVGRRGLALHANLLNGNISMAEIVLRGIDGAGKSLLVFNDESIGLQVLGKGSQALIVYREFVRIGNHDIYFDGTSKQDKSHEITGKGEGLILKSPNDTRWIVTVDNDGSLVTTELE